MSEEENERNNASPHIPICGDHGGTRRGLLEETTAFVEFCSGGFMPLIWGKSDKPWQPSRLDVLGHRSPVASRLVTRPGEGQPGPPTLAQGHG